MVDIRNIIKGDRGLIKKFQSFVPGYKKYRNCEDLRTADDILRREVGKELRMVEENIISARDQASKKMDMDQITSIGNLVNISHRITKKVIHAQQGYSPWISGDVRLEEEQLKDLYDHDLALFKETEMLKDVTSILADLFRNSDPGRSDHVITVKKKLEEFEHVFDSRISLVTRVAQK